MNHKQILDKLAAKYLVQGLDEDIAHLVGSAMLFLNAPSKSETYESVSAYVMPKLLRRWNCVLEGGEHVASQNYKDKTVLAMCILLHKYGMRDPVMTSKAISAIDRLNQEVALSDDFFRKSNEIKAFLQTPPVPLKRSPSQPERITFYREKDVMAIQLEGKYYAAYVNDVSAPNVYPIIEFYDGVFTELPSWEQVKTLRAKGETYQDNTQRVSRFGVNGMKYLPDLAGQITLIQANVNEKPDNSHLGESIGLYSVIDIFWLQDDIQRIFG